MPERKAIIRDEAVVVLVFNAESELLLQLRSEDKIRYPFHWEVSASGMVEPGQTPEEAAQQEILEELGIRFSGELTKLFSFVEKSDISIPVTVFSLVWNGPIKTNHEVADTKWCSQDELSEVLTREKCTPNLKYLASRKKKLWVN